MLSNIWWKSRMISINKINEEEKKSPSSVMLTYSSMKSSFIFLLKFWLEERKSNFVIYKIIWMIITISMSYSFVTTEKTNYFKIII